MKPITDAQARRIRLVIKNFRELEPDQINQAEAEIKKGTRRPCGCVAVHIVRWFRLSMPKTSLYAQPQDRWFYFTIYRHLYRLLGIRESDLYRCGAGVSPFGTYPWKKHPADVFQAVLDEVELAERADV